MQNIEDVPHTKKNEDGHLTGALNYRLICNMFIRAQRAKEEGLKGIVFCMFLAVSLMANGEVTTLNHEDVPSDVLTTIQSYSTRTIEMMNKGGAKDFDYSENSVKFLSAVIDEEGPTYSEKAKSILPSVWGAYFGDALIKKYGGKWVKLGNSYAVLIDDSQFLFPMVRVEKHIANGTQDSIYSMYLAVASMNEIADKIEKP